MSTLYLHIGTPKTGTTAIQAFCVANRQLLNEMGYEYPLLPYRFQRIVERRNGHFLIARYQSEDAEENMKTRQRIWQEAWDTIAGLFDSYPNIVLSDEGIWNSTSKRCPDMWERLKAEAQRLGFAVKIIVYLRRQDQFLDAWWNQQVKEGYNSWSKMAWENIRDKKCVVLDYYKHLENIAKYFGRENIIVRVFERDHFVNGDIIPDFLETIGIQEKEGFDTGLSEANIRLGANALEIKRILNNLPDLDEGDRSFLRTTIQKVSAAAEKQEGKYSMFSPEEAKRFLDRYAGSNVLVARDYLGNDSALFQGIDEKAVKWTPENPYMYRDIIRYFGEITLIQQRSILRLQEQLDNLRDKLKHPLRTMKKKIIN